MLFYESNQIGSNTDFVIEIFIIKYLDTNFLYKGKKFFSKEKRQAFPTISFVLEKKEFREMLHKKTATSAIDLHLDVAFRYLTAPVDSRLLSISLSIFSLPMFSRLAPS